MHHRIYSYSEGVERNHETDSKYLEKVKTNFELMKLNKSHPQWLGDYDVFAVDIKKKTIWIVECKVIEKVAFPIVSYPELVEIISEVTRK